jgi:hypothetical protein
VEQKRWPRPSRREMALTLIGVATVIAGIATNAWPVQLLAIAALLGLGIRAVWWILVLLFMAREPYLNWLIRSAEKNRDSLQEEAHRFERRAEILRQAKQYGSDWQYVAKRSQKKKGLLSRLFLPGQGWRKWAYAPFTFPAFIAACLVAAVPGLARWEAFHAEGGYAEPPASLMRIFMLWRQIPPQNISGTLILGYFVPPVLLLIFADPLTAAGQSPATRFHPQLLAIGVLAWALLLTLPGELGIGSRGKVRVALWLAGLGLIIWANLNVHRGNAVEAFALGARFTIITDYVGMFVLMWLVSAKNLPEEGEWRKREKPA